VALSKSAKGGVASQKGSEKVEKGEKSGKRATLCYAKVFRKARRRRKR